MKNISNLSKNGGTTKAACGADKSYMAGCAPHTLKAWRCASSPGGRGVRQNCPETGETANPPHTHPSSTAWVRKGLAHTLGGLAASSGLREEPRLSRTEVTKGAGRATF